MTLNLASLRRRAPIADGLSAGLICLLLLCGGCMTVGMDAASWHIGLEGEELGTPEALLVADDGSIAIELMAEVWVERDVLRFRRYALLPPGTVERYAERFIDEPSYPVQVQIGSQPRAPLAASWDQSLVTTSEDFFTVDSVPARSFRPSPGLRRHATPADLPPAFASSRRVERSRSLERRSAPSAEAALFHLETDEQTIQIIIVPNHHNSRRRPSGHIVRGVLIAPAMVLDVVTAPVQMIGFLAHLLIDEPQTVGGGDVVFEPSSKPKPQQ